MIHYRRQTAIILVLLLLLCSHSGCASSQYYAIPIEQENGIGFAGNESWSLVSGMFSGLPLKLNIQHEDFPSDLIQYSVHCSIGRYRDRFNPNWFDKEFTVNNNSLICWTSLHVDFEDPEQVTFHDYGDGAADYHIVFTDIVIRCEGHIVGYAVICFDRNAYITEDDPNPQIYELHLMDAFLFPKRDGEYQDIPEEYVRECITRAVENYS